MGGAARGRNADLPCAAGAYGRLGEGLREAARADDGTVEAIEDPTRRFALGVLWHPEEDEDSVLFEALVAEAARYREERG